MNTDIRSFFLACYMLTSHTVNRSTALAAVLQFSFVELCSHPSWKYKENESTRLQVAASCLIAHC